MEPPTPCFAWAYGVVSCPQHCHPPLSLLVPETGLLFWRPALLAATLLLLSSEFNHTFKKYLLYFMLYFQVLCMIGSVVLELQISGE